MKRASRKANSKRDHRTLDNSLLEQRHSESLPSIGSTQESNVISQRSQGRIKRHVSRKEPSKINIQRNTFDSDAAPTYFPSPLSTQPLNIDNATPFTTAAWAGGDMAISPPSILHSYRDKCMEKYSSMKCLSIPWLNDADEDRPLSMMSTKRTVLRPMAPSSPMSLTSPHREV